jgi:magnesium chelatase family protein
VSVRRVPLADLASEPSGEPTAPVRERVLAARARQLERQGCLNAQLKPSRLRHLAALEPGSRRTLERWAEQKGLSARGFHRAWRVARTAADLEGTELIADRHVLEALGYRLHDVVA